MAWRVAGTVKQNGIAVAREIHVLRQSDGVRLATQTSNGGAFDIQLAGADPVHILAEPAAGYRPVVLGPYTPEVV